MSPPQVSSYSFSVEGLKKFVIQDKRKIKKVVRGIGNIDGKDNKLMLVRLHFSIKNFRKLIEDEILSLLKTGSDFFHFIDSFGEYENQKNIKIWMLEDKIQKLETSTCGPFQIYFYKNSFFPSKNCKIHFYNKLTSEVVIFPLDREQNDNLIKEYIKGKKT